MPALYYPDDILIALTRYPTDFKYEVTDYFKIHTKYVKIFPYYKCSFTKNLWLKVQMHDLMKGNAKGKDANSRIRAAQHYYSVSCSLVDDDSMELGLCFSTNDIVAVTNCLVDLNALIEDCKYYTPEDSYSFWKGLKGTVEYIMKCNSRDESDTIREY